MFVTWLLLIIMSSVGLQSSPTMSMKDWLNETYVRELLIQKPTAPTGASGFEYGGGRLLVHPITVYLLWVGEWRESSRQALRKAVLSLTSVYDVPEGYPSLAMWWKIVTQYKNARGKRVSAEISLGDECWMSAEEVNAVDLLRIVTSAFSIAVGLQQPINCTRHFRKDENAVYHVLISENVKVFGGEKDHGCSSRATRLFRIDGSGPRINLAWHRQSTTKEFCHLWTAYGSYLKAPNGGSGGLDTLISSVLAQTADMATNWDFNGWVALNKLKSSIGEQCPSPTGWSGSIMPVLDDPELGISWNVYGLNGTRYLVRQLWNEGQKNCALQPLKSCHGAVKMSSAKGTITHGLIVDHKVGLQPYNSKLRCEWRVKVPNAKYIHLDLNYLAVDPGDILEVFYCKKGSCENVVLKGLSSKKRLISPAVSGLRIKFTTGSHVAPNGMGWELNYRAGFCRHRPSKIRSKAGHITDGTPRGLRYWKNVNCSWFFDSKPGTKVRLKFNRLNIYEHDMVRVYQGRYVDMRKVLATYSGNISHLPEETFFGPVLLVFTTRTNKGTGWALEYYMDSPWVQATSSAIRIETAAIAIGAVCGVLVVIIGSWLVLRKMVKISDTDELHQALLFPVPKFPIEMIKKATHGFRATDVLAQGASGNVYRGTLEEGAVVAIKNHVSEMELEILRRIRSPRVVNFLGCSVDGEQAYLIFEYMHGGSLSRRILDKRFPPISWANRLKIAFQVSAAIEYLHTYAEPCIVHCNVKAENVLLDGACNAKLGGFGSAIGCNNLDKSPLKAKDVSGFGKLVLELLTGKAAWDAERGKATSRAKKALDAIKAGLTGDFLDGRLQGTPENSPILLKMGELAAWCLYDKDAPNMVEVACAVRQVFAIYLRSSRKEA